MSRTTLIGALTAVLALLGALAAAPAGTGRPVDVRLEPGQEVAPFAGVDGAAGAVRLRLNPGQQQVCVDGAVDGFDPALAHIHKGAAGTNGPVVVSFDALLEGRRLSGCVPADRALIRELLTSPEEYYVNVHQGGPSTEAFFRGVRGQLGR